jgi:hypothetical protein
MSTKEGLVVDPADNLEGFILCSLTFWHLKALLIKANQHGVSDTILIKRIGLKAI